MSLLPVEQQARTLVLIPDQLIRPLVACGMGTLQALTVPQVHTSIRPISEQLSMIRDLFWKQMLPDSSMLRVKH